MTRHEMKRLLGTAACIGAVVGLCACASSQQRLIPPPSPDTAAASADQAAVGLSEDARRVSPPQIIPGSGVMVAGERAVADTGSGQAGGFQVDFVDAPIATVLSALLGEGLSVPYVLDPKVQGTLTLQATRGLRREELLLGLETALKAQGFVLIVRDGVYYVTPAANGVRQVAELSRAGGVGAGFGVHVVPLQFVGAAEMAKILQPFAGEGGVVRVDMARNLLLLSGTRPEIATLLEVVRTFDVDWLSGMSFALFPLEYVDAKTIAEELREIFAQADSPISGVVRLVPLDRLNSLMVVTPQPRYLTEVENWIRRLDLGASTPGRRIYVYDVQNGKANDLAQSLGDILSISVATGGTGERMSGGSGGSVSIDSAGGSTVLGGSGASTRAVGGGREDGSVSRLDAGELKIVPNNENNSLLILATPSEFQIIEAALKRLDVLPIQVLIEASIAEVSLTDDIRYGLQWSYDSRNGPITLSESGSGTINSQFPGFSFLYLGRQDIRAVLNAIESLTNVKVLSSPKLMVLNNREATLQVGDQVPISVQSAVGTIDANSPIVNSIQLRDTGVILKVTPRANKSGRVVLEVAQEVSDAVHNEVSGIDSPSIAQRKIATTVSVKDGDTVALGGLIRDTQSRGGSGIPYLRKIPLLGQVFGSTSKTNRRTELIVLITPHVLRSSDELGEAMLDLERQFRSLQNTSSQWRKDLQSQSGSNRSAED